MKCKILYDKKGRIRVRAVKAHMSLREADILEYYLKSIHGVSNVLVYDRTCDAVIEYNCEREEVIRAISKFAFTEATAALVPERTSRELNREYQDKLVNAVIFRYVKKWLIPWPIRRAITLFTAAKRILLGVKSLLKGKLDVPVLDAAAIIVALLKGDFSTASSIMFLLKIGDILDEWTHKKSVEDLAQTMSLGIEKVWLKAGENEVLVPLKDVKAGDEIVVRTGGMIPLDGKISDGVVTVNQSSMTGEFDAVPKSKGALVYAGTVVEDGECLISVEKAAGNGRYDRIIKMIEESEKLKSDTEDKAANLADKLVPFSLLGAGLTYLFTGNLIKTAAILMVDYSCALKLSMPIAMLSALREGIAHGISFKGGKFIEVVSKADTVVFDKTGTLTHASPKVAGIVTFLESDENEILRTAACLEEHYPHSIANAVVNEAAERGLTHEECHSSVEYIVAHGIIGIVDGQRIAIGSHHFIFEDEGATISDEKKFNSISGEYSQLYMSCDGQLVAVILIEDPIRKEAVKVIEELRKLGFSNIVMMTGDSDKTAKAVSKKVGVDRYFSEVLPEDKAEYVKRLKEEGHTVIMIGDGINDAPALSQADAGIAVSTGAAIAREIADITVSTEDLWALKTIRELSEAAMKRIGRNYRFIISFNSALIALGVIGILTPQISALLHNVSTLAVGLKSMTALLPPKEEKENK